MLFDVRHGASNGHVCRVDSAVSNETFKGRVVMMCGGNMLLDVETFLGGVCQWYEHEKLCLLVTI